MKKLLISAILAMMATTFILSCSSSVSSSDDETEISTTTTPITPEPELEHADPMLSQPLTLEATEAGDILIAHPWSKLQVKKNGNLLSLETETVDPSGANVEGYKITVAENDIITFYAEGSENPCNENDTYDNYEPEPEEPFMYFVKTPECYIYGNIMSLVTPTNFETATELSDKDSDFAFLFMFDNKLKNHETKRLLLPATALSPYCYYGMFAGCSSLTIPPTLPATTLTIACYRMMLAYSGMKNAPELPATTLAEECYTGMFSNCTELTETPDLPATTLAEKCYMNMFDECTKITSTPILPARTLKKQCYQCMFRGCTALISAPALPATAMEDTCYDSMFEDCTSLTSAPALPATTVARFCYGNMFKGCTELTTGPNTLPATTAAEGCYYHMFENCSKLSSAPALPATTLARECYINMFRNCTSLTKAPDLPASKLESGCYDYMFNKCTKLNYLKCLATDFGSGHSAYWPSMWLTDVASSGTIVRPSAAADVWNIQGSPRIPTGWTVVDSDSQE